MWFSSRYMMLRLPMEINVSMERDLIYSIARSSAYNWAWKVFGYPRNLVAIWFVKGH